MKIILAVIAMLGVLKADAHQGFWHMSISANIAQSPRSLNFYVDGVSSPSRVQTDICHAFSIMHLNRSGDPVKRPGQSIYPITYTGAGVGFYSDSNCTTPTSSIVIESNQSTGTVYLKNSHTGLSSFQTDLTISLQNFVPGSSRTATYNYYRPTNCADAFSKSLANLSGAAVTSGTYVIDPDENTSTIQPFQIYCEMGTSPSWKGQMRGLTLVGAVRTQESLAQFVESISGYPGASQIISDAKFQALLATSSRLVFASETGSLAFYVPKASLSSFNRNKNNASLRMTDFNSTTLRQTISTSGHNMFVHDYYAESGNYSGLSMTPTSFNLYPGSPNLGSPQPYFLWNGSSFTQVTMSQAAGSVVVKSRPASEFLMIYVWN